MWKACLWLQRSRFGSGKTSEKAVFNMFAKGLTIDFWGGARL